MEKQQTGPGRGCPIKLLVCAQQRHQCHPRHGAGFWAVGEILQGAVLRKYEYALYLESIVLKLRQFENYTEAVSNDVAVLRKWLQNV